MIKPSFWRIYTNIAVSKADIERLEYLFDDWPVVRFKQQVEPHNLICYDCNAVDVDEVADRLHTMGYEVITTQSGVGPIP